MDELNQREVIHLLGQFDLPCCPRHGIRLATDFFVSEDGEELERGKCGLCNKSYVFEVE